MTIEDILHVLNAAHHWSSESWYWLPVIHQKRILGGRFLAWGIPPGFFLNYLDGEAIAKEYVRFGIKRARNLNVAEHSTKEYLSYLQTFN